MPSTSPVRGSTVALAVVGLVLAGVGPVAGGAADPAVVGADTRTNATGGVNLTLLVGGSAVYDGLDDYATFRDASDGPVLGRTDTLERGETLLLAFRSEQLNRTYGAVEGPSPTARFFDAVNRTNATVAVTSPVGPSCREFRIDLEESRSKALVERDGPGFVLALDTGAVATEGGCGSGLKVPGGYEATVAVPSGNGSRRSTRYFELREEERDVHAEVRTRRGGPSLAATLDGAAAVREAERDGTLVPSSRVVAGEVVVLSLRSERLDRAYANASGPNATARLVEAVGATGGRLQLVARDESSADHHRVVLPGPGVRTLHDAGNGTFHLVLDTGRVRLREGTGTVGLSTVPEATFDFDLSVPPEAGADRRFESRFFIDDPTGWLRIARNRSALGERPVAVAVVRPGGEFVVSPTTNLAPGWNLTLRAVATNGTTLATRHGRSRGDDRSGTSTYRFDVGSLSEEDRFTVVLRGADGTLVEVPVAVGDRPVLRDATVRRVRTGPELTTVRFGVTARYPGAGYVVVRNGSEYVGFPVPEGQRTRVTGTTRVRTTDDRTGTVRLIAVYDANGNGRFDGPDQGGPLDPPFRTREGTLVQTEVALPTPTPTPTVTAPPPGTTVSVSDGQSGFGVLGVVAALAAVAVGARRR